MNKLITQAVDNIISELGSYNPIELLLRQGRLRYSDYELWRSGEQEFICEALMGSAKRINSLLDTAKDYALQLDLIAETFEAHGWQGPKLNQLLKFCPDGTGIRTELLNTQYVRSDNQPQLDLFFDNQGVQLANDLKLALSDRNATLAEDKLNQLEHADPNHSLCGQGAQLLGALQHLQQQPELSNPEEALQYLQQTLVPVAKDALTDKARDFISPFWRRLAHNLNPENYLPEKPQLHPAWCYEQILDWPQVIDNILKINNWQQQPRLFASLSHAYYNNDQRIDSIQVLCDYCWIHPQADIFMPDDFASTRAWNQFVDQELDEDWGQQHFPAWLLLQEPGLNKNLVTRDATPVAFGLLQNLLAKNDCEDQTDLRKDLQQAHAGIFAYFLNRF